MKWTNKNSREGIFENAVSSRDILTEKFLKWEKKKKHVLFIVADTETVSMYTPWIQFCSEGFICSEV